ncbi:MAG: nucleotidyltransferase family protein [Litorimonas sp.]
MSVPLTPQAPHVSVLILAGQREGVVDTLCQNACVSHKADVPILGRKMLDYVLGALQSSSQQALSLKQPYHISGYSVDSDDRLSQAPSGAGPADSVSLALENEIALPCLVTTCDHALLTPEMLEHFIRGAQQSSADFCVGLASQSVIAPAYPETKRTYLKFSDDAVSGCNMFYVANDKGRAAIEFWKSAQHLRKRPIKLARKIGLGVGLRYALGRLSLQGAFEYAGKRIGITAAPILIPIAEAAMDVDKPSDLTLVETILKDRHLAKSL